MSPHRSVPVSNSRWLLVVVFRVLVIFAVAILLNKLIADRWWSPWLGFPAILLVLIVLWGWWDRQKR